MMPDQLRELADRLSDPCSPDDDDLETAADYLRVCADAQPVAWRTFDGEGNYDYRAYELNEDYADEWNRRNPNHVGWVEPLYTHPAPAAPQAEPCIGNDPICPCQDGDACHYKDAADGTKAWPVPQAEPKREPLPGLAPTHRCPACGALWRQCDDASWNLRSALCCGLCDAGRVELVRLLDEPKREPLHELPPLPEPGAYAYEWRLQTGSVYRSFSARHYNGVPCDDQVLFFTADQMREYARTVLRTHGIGGSDE